MMKVISVLYFLIGMALVSCNGQSSQQIHSQTPITGSILIGDTVAKLGNNIMVVYQDQKDNYWFGSWEAGLYRYDGRTITHFTTKDGLPHNRVKEIKADKLGNLYINTTKGICQFNGQSFIPLTLVQSSTNNNWQLSPNDVWFTGAKSNGFVFRFDGKELHHLQLPKSKLDIANKHSNPGGTNASPYAVYSIYTDTQGSVWFGTEVFGACRYNGKAFDWIEEPDVTELHNGPVNGVRSIIEDKNGDFWFNSAYRYTIYNKSTSSANDQSNPAFYQRKRSIGSLDGKKDGNLIEYLSITKDKAHNLWIATYDDGVWKYDGTTVTHYPVTEKGENINIFSIYCDNQGDLWLGTEANGAYKFDRQAFVRFNP
jgi:ligand-binding sensor domain-containing protein